jgi:hypothetical protein
LLYYDAQRNTLFIAKEIFFELDVDLIAEFLFLELSDGTLTKPQIHQLFKENYTPEAHKNRNYTLDEYIRELLERRSVFYYLAELVNISLERQAEMLFSKEFTEERNYYYGAQIMAVIETILREKPVHLKGFIKQLVELDYGKGTAKNIKRMRNSELLNLVGNVNIETLYKVMGERGAWSTSLHLLVKKMQLNLKEGDLAEFMYNLLDYILIRDNFLMFDKYGQDRWFLEEDKRLWKEYEQFIEDMRIHIQREFSDFEKHIKAKSADKARAVLKDLEGLRGDFPMNLLIEEKTKALAIKLSDTIDNMSKIYERFLEGLKDHCRDNSRQEKY